MNQINTMFFKIIDYRYNTFNLEEIAPYIHIDIENWHIVFDDETKEKSVKIETNEMQFHDCTKEDFDKNDYEREFWELYGVMNKEKLICLDTENNKIYLEGNREYEHELRNSSHIKFVVKSCSDDNLT